MPLARFIHRRERQLALFDDNRVVRPFEWGEELADPRFAGNAKNLPPSDFFKHYSQKAVAESDEFFGLNEVSDYRLDNSELTWTSQIQTPTPENNLVRTLFFPAEKQKTKRAVVVLPHWNAKADAYIALCRVFNKTGIAALRLTLPYHEKRNDPILERADHLVSPNIGRTLQSVRQAVLDTKAAVAWLKMQGYERVGIVGTSIGSCIGFLALVHDLDIDVAVFNHVSGFVADVVWRGISTYHVKQGLETAVTLEELREYWLPISPMAYFKKLQNQPARPMHYIYTLYDLTFPIDLSRQTIDAFEKHNIKHDKTVIPCGHYTLGERPWVYLDGWKIVSFLRKNL